jgi:hypothetical protein
MVSHTKRLGGLIPGAKQAVTALFEAGDKQSIFARGSIPIPVLALLDPELSDLDLKVYGIGLLYATAPAGNHLFASPGYLGELFHRHERKIRAAFARLCRLGYLVKTQERRGRHVVYNVALSVPPGRLPALRSISTGVGSDDLNRGTRPKTAGLNPQPGRKRPPLYVKASAVYSDSGSAVYVHSPLQRRSGRRIAAGESADFVVGQELNAWRLDLAAARSDAARARMLCDIGIARVRADELVLANTPAAILAAAARLDHRTDNLAGAFVHALQHPNGHTTPADRPPAGPQ